MTDFWMGDWIANERMAMRVAGAARSPNAQAKITGLTEARLPKRRRAVRRKRRRHGRSRPAPRVWKTVRR